MNMFYTSKPVLNTTKHHPYSFVDRISLEKVYGFTVFSNLCLAQSCEGMIAYLAGCTIIIYDPGTKYQEFIISKAKKQLTSVSYSCDGRLIATGESGHDPKLRIWDVREKSQVYEFGGHKFSIQCVGFLYNPELVLAVSIGSMHDMDVNVWNVKAKMKVSSNKIAQRIQGISFAENGEYFVTVGNRHVKFWYLCLSDSYIEEIVPLRGRPALLGDKKTYNFCGVVCGQNSYANFTYIITTNGFLCELNENRIITRFVPLHVDRTNSVQADSEFLFIGCSYGTTLIYLKASLEFFAMLPRPHYLGVDIAQGLTTSHITESFHNPDLVYPDCIALSYDKYNSILATFYNDHSYYVWDLQDLNQIRKLDSHLFHSATCTSIDLFNSPFNYDNSCYFQTNNSMPLDSIITCSADNTIRIWTPLFKQAFNNNKLTNLKRNIYSRELLKIIYLSNDLAPLCHSLNTSNEPSSNSTSKQGPVDQLQRCISNTEAISESKHGARCLKISPRGVHLATGDRVGTLRVYDLKTLELVYSHLVHQGEILGMDYANDETILASSSRDRKIRIFNVIQKYELLQILEDHSAAITAVKFCACSFETDVYLVSCGYDKSLMIRAENSSGIDFHSRSAKSSFLRTSYVVEKQTFYDIEIEPNNNFVYAVSQDRMIRAYSVKTGKRVKKMRGSLNEDGYLLKVTIDNSGCFLATSCTDKCVYLWDLNSNQCIATLHGHSEVVNDLKFSADNRHLITAGDGCLFFWNISQIYSSGLLSHRAIQTISDNPSSNTSSPKFISKHQASFKPPAPRVIHVMPAKHMKVEIKEASKIEAIHQRPGRTMVQSRSCFSNLSSTGLTQIDESFSVKDKDRMNLIDLSSSSLMTNFNVIETKSMSDMDKANKVIRKRAVWGPEINLQFAVMEDDSRVQSAVVLGKAKRVQSANGLLNEAIEKNSRVTKQKCVVL